MQGTQVGSYADGQIAQTELSTPKRTLGSASRWEDNGDRDGQARRQQKIMNEFIVLRHASVVPEANITTVLRSSCSSRLP